MIISRTPFRVSFLGGGSDLAAFYEKRMGCVLSSTIDKYMYISIHPYFYAKKIQLKYSNTELVDNTDDIKHPIFKEVLKKVKNTGIEIDSVADIPSNAGLGSSSAFTVGLLHSMYAYNSIYVSRQRLAEEACDIEINRLKEPIGKQDQYASAFGGLNLIKFYSDHRVDVEPIIIPHGKQRVLESYLMLFFVGMTRAASSILSEQKENILNQQSVNDAVIQMAEMAQEARLKLSVGDIDSLGTILYEGWQLKQKMAKNITNDVITHYYNIAISNGAIGGKLLGAGSGGFLLFYVYPDARLRVQNALRELQEVPFHFDNTGTKIIYVGE